MCIDLTVRDLSRLSWTRIGVVPNALCPGDIDSSPAKVTLATQGPASRPGPFQRRLYRLAVRSQVGRSRRARPLPVRHPALGPAGAGGIVPQRAGQPGATPTAPHPRPDQVPAPARDAAVVTQSAADL